MIKAFFEKLWLAQVEAWREMGEAVADFLNMD